VTALYDRIAYDPIICDPVVYRGTENPEIGVFVRIPNPSGFFVQPDRGGGAVVSVPVSHARNHVFVVRQKLTVSRRPFLDALKAASAIR
jgi:hypothetical protein